MSKVRGEPEPESVNERQYSESQKQRYLERRIRRAKLDVAIAKATQDDEAVKDANRTLRARQAAMREFISDTGRTRRYDREYTPTECKEESANGKESNATAQKMFPSSAPSCAVRDTTPSASAPFRTTGT